MKLSSALSKATDALYTSLSGSPVVITQADVSALEERVRAALTATDYNKPFEIKITLDDDAEFVDVTAKSGIVEETIGLKFVTPDGRIMVLVDTDGDGK